METGELFLRFAVAISLGALIGLERGWQERHREEGHRVAGLRTFTLTATLGAVLSVLLVAEGDVALGLAFFGFAIFIAVAHAVSVPERNDAGITTTVALLVTFGLGALAVRGEIVPAAALGAVTATVLHLKATLHEWLRRLERVELFAILRLILVSTVALPVLPDQGFGPWQIWNPYELWWMVVLIAGISLAGYFAVKLIGVRRGLGLSAIIGGIVSSTALTVSYAQMARQRPGLSLILSAGIVIASAMMFIRTLLVAAVIEPRLIQQLQLPLLTMFVIAIVGGGILWRSGSTDEVGHEGIVEKPFALANALRFGVLLAAVMWIARYLHETYGDVGVYVVAAISGLVDVDPMTLSVSRAVADGLPVQTASIAIVIGAGVNTLFKAGLSIGMGGWRVGGRVLSVLALALCSGVLVALGTQ